MNKEVIFFIIVVLFTILSLILCSWTDTNPLYIKSCTETNWTNLVPVFGIWDSNAGANINLPITVNCVQVLCHYNPDKISEEYRKEVCK